MMKILKERGITLVALVLTIIILLILAGVTLNLALSENGIFSRAKEATESYKLSSEKEYLEQNITSIKLGSYMEDVNSEKLGEALYDQSLYNGDRWNMIFTDTERYGTGWNYIKKGTNIQGYGETNYIWLINYETGEIKQLEEGKYDKFNFEDSVAIRDNLSLNIDASNLENGNWDGIINHGNTLYDNENKALIFDGKDDYLELTKPGDFSKGFTFEIYMNLDRLYYGDNGSGGQSTGLLCRISDILNSDPGECMKFYLETSSWTNNRDCLACKFYYNSLWDGEGKDAFTAQAGGAFFTKENIFEINKDKYITITYQVYEENGKNNDEFMTENKADKISLYIDGQEAGYTYYGHDSYVEGCNIWNKDDSPFFIGVCPLLHNGNLFLIKGKVYTTRLYTKSLTREEIEMNYNQTLTYRKKLSK